ncbi:restriction endonuclease [Streptomyces sp. ISL-96]|uniref:restriction endonuclease n=1 Tax=Streptomyces sp. ISL-96 TaxID=2819191 RepID=UPI001BE970CB|nr:restriction endonuclease [Streptomyces sp. ISL-96]MBT2488669.1 restriction endonuclease [Streptomyces sp. ISL-96]
MALPWWVWGLFAMAAIVAAGRGMATLWAHPAGPWVMTGLGVGGLGMLYVGPGRRALARRPVPGAALRYSLTHLDALGDRDFELAVHRLLRRDGFAATHVGKAGDKGADVIAVDRWGRTFVVQCKRLRRDRKVGDQDVQRVNGTYRHDHGAAFAVIVTTGGFTLPALASGPGYGIHMVDRGGLEQWADLGMPLYGLLGIAAPPHQRRWQLSR